MKETKEMGETKGTFLIVQDMVLIAVFTALIAICSWITIPAMAGQVPFTLQTFAVFVTAGILGAKRGTLSVIVYILLGLVGVPVFSGLSGGLSALMSPSGGYIIGFIFTAIIIGSVSYVVKGKSELIKTTALVVSMVFGDIACFIVGTIWFMVVTNINLAGSLSMCVIPFIIPDVVKIILATIIVNRVKKYVRIFN